MKDEAFGPAQICILSGGWIQWYMNHFRRVAFIEVSVLLPEGCHARWLGFIRFLKIQTITVSTSQYKSHPFLPADVKFHQLPFLFDSTVLLFVQLRLLHSERRDWLWDGAWKINIVYGYSPPLKFSLTFALVLQSQVWFLQLRLGSASPCLSQKKRILVFAESNIERNQPPTNNKSKFSPALSLWIGDCLVSSGDCFFHVESMEINFTWRTVLFGVYVSIDPAEVWENIPYCFLKKPRK